MPELSHERASMKLTAAAAKAVRKGHPWVFDQGIEKINRDVGAGALAILHDAKRDFLGIGLYDPESPIRVRVLHVGKQLTIDEDWLAGRIDEALAVRKELIDAPETTGFRLVHGENDRVPGFVADIYDNVIVFKLDTVAWIPHLQTLIDIFRERFSPSSIILRMSRTVSRSPLLGKKLFDGAAIHGHVPDGAVTFLENGITFEADPVGGQKTGFFLDQRENRERVEKLSAGKDVLNVFSYTGGFSLYAARGGAITAVSLDLSAPALAGAVRNFALNRHDANIAAATHEVVEADAFAGMEALSREDLRYGVVVIDPPSFARKQADVPGAVAAYERLSRLGAELVERGGILVSASCSARVPAEDFFGAVAKGITGAGRTYTEIERTAHPVDHPVGFPEGAYLKCLYTRLS